MTTPELFERRGADICISIEYDYEQSSVTPTWVNYAQWIATKRFVKVGNRILRWDEFEPIMHGYESFPPF